MELQSFAQASYENGYSRQEELTFRDCGPDKKVRISTLLGKMAIFGGFDYDARGLTHDRLLDMRMVFLFSRAAIRIHRRPEDREILKISTWEDGVRGAHMRRVYEMEDESGAVAVSAKSDWILVDPLSRRILRPSAFTARQLSPCPKEIDCPEPKKIRFPQGDAEERGVWTVPWSALDGNGHLFSGNYGDVVWDYLPPDLRERPVRDFAINYSKEATLGEPLRLLGFRETDQETERYWMEGIGAEGTCFLAEILFA